MNKDIYHIRGMHCSSCELTIEDNISKIVGVKKTKTNYRNGIAEVYYDNRKPSYQEVERAIRNSGYSIGKQDTSFLSSEPQDYLELIFAGVILLIIWMWLKIFGVLDLGYSFSNSPGLLVVLLIGLTAGVSSCMALIGGIVLGISARHAELHPEASPSQKFRPHIFFNLGRITSYILLGGFMGLIGSSFRFSNSMLGALIIIVGVTMFLLGLKLIEIFPKLSGGLTLPKQVSRFFGINKDVKEYSHKSSFITGALTFFLPCGFTQAMQLYAMSTGSFTRGALIMGLFALGTMPGLLGIGGATSLIKGWFRGYFFKFAGLIVIILGLWNISNGYNLTGITIGSASVGDTGQVLDSRIENGQQIVDMMQSGYGYSPNRLIIKKDIPVKWVINSTNPYHCSSYLVVPSLGISQALQPGINELAFVPTQEGTIKFTCGMGMFTGYFNVIN